MSTDLDLDQLAGSTSRAARAVPPQVAGATCASTARGVHHVALLSADVERTIRFYQDAARVPAHRAVREPRLQGQHPLLLRHRQRQLARVLRLPRASTSAPTRRCSAGSTTSRSRRARDLDAPEGQARQGRRAVRPHQRLVALLPRSRWRSPRADQRSAGGDVRPPRRLRRRRTDFPAERGSRRLTTPSARSSTDRASDYGSEGWGFESLRARWRNAGHE